MQKLTNFKVIFDLFTVCVYFIQQQNCKLYYTYLMIISEIQSEIGHYSCDSADFSHHAILFFDIVLNIILHFYYAPNFEKVEGLYCFGLVRPSVRYNFKICF